MIVVDQLTKKYGDAIAVSEVSLMLSVSEILAVVGPSGSGKTTLLRLIAGLERPDSGKILIDGIEASTATEIVSPHLRKLSLIFQDLALWPHMSAVEHIKFILQKENLSENELKLKARQSLEQVNLDGYKDRYPHQLSGGERQRLAIARALASNPAYLLMDEPFSQVDTIIREELQDLVLRLKKNLQTGIIYVTHNSEEALALADRLAVMNEGKILQIDHKEKVIDEPNGSFVKRLLKIS